MCSCIAKVASYCLVTDETSESIEEKLRSQELVHGLVQRAEWSRSLTILLIGESGVGKATLVNGIIGEELIVRNQSSVQLISKREINGIDVTVIDTAEIMDAEEDEIEEIKQEAAKGVDLVLFCIQMTQVRFRRNDIELIWKVREVFPVEIWNNAIFVLTYANQLRRAGGSYENRFMEKLSRWKDVLFNTGKPYKNHYNIIVEKLSQWKDILLNAGGSYENHFMEKLSQWKDILLNADGSYENHFMEKLSQWRDVLLNAVEEHGKAAQEVAQDIPVIPAGYKDPNLPHCDKWSNRNKCENWFSKLWYVVLERIQCGKKIALLEINRNRFKISTGNINLRTLPYEMVIIPTSEETEFEITVTIYDVVGVMVAFVFARAGFYYTLKDSKGSKGEGKEEDEGVLRGDEGENRNSNKKAVHAARTIQEY